MDHPCQDWFVVGQELYFLVSLVNSLARSISLFLFADNFENGLKINIMQLAAWNIDKTFNVMSSASIFSHKFELDENDVILYVLKVKALSAFFVVKIVFAKLALNQKLVLFIGITEDLVNLLDVAYGNEFRDCLAFYYITFRLSRRWNLLAFMHFNRVVCCFVRSRSWCNPYDVWCATKSAFVISLLQADWITCRLFGWVLCQRVSHVPFKLWNCKLELK